jgi:YjbE family integral membrane protein
MSPAEFLMALMAIVVIDLVLAGDNAIVIALAARSLPAHLQKRAILWGAFGAIAVRSLMTVILVWLLQVPGLLALGGAALLWIGHGLMRGDGEHGAASSPGASGFWGALRTIVVADAVMGLDNVLAVAGAAHGSYLLVVTGLAISVPIVLWGSALVLRLVERFPGVVYLGAAVLLWTAVKMITGEPLLKPWLADWPWAERALWALVPLLLWLGFAGNHRRRESRIQASLSEFSRQRPGRAGNLAGPSGSAPSASTGDPEMLRILVPVDGSPNALLAVRHVVAEYRRQGGLEVHLLNVQPRLPRHIARFVSRRDRQGWQQEWADLAMAESLALLSQAGVPCQAHRASGSRAAEICAAASRLQVHHLVMGTSRKNSLTRMLEDSVTNQVLEATPVPVEVVAGQGVSRWERWGLPTGVLAGAGGLLWLAFE